MRPDAELPAGDLALGSTQTLVQRARGGAEEARTELVRLYEPRLQRLLAARIPTRTRGLMETQDLVQDVLLRAFRHLDTFEPRGTGSFWIWLRSIATNQLRDHGRRHVRRGAPDPLASQTSLHPAGNSPAGLDVSIENEEAERFDSALERVPERERTAVTMRLELELPYEQIAAELEYASTDAARMAIKRTLRRIAEDMSRGNA